MMLTYDMPLRELMQQILDNFEPHTVLHCIAELEKHPDPNYFADKANALLPKHPELFEDMQ
jgi:hypothetical protein